MSILYAIATALNMSVVSVNFAIYIAIGSIANLFLGAIWVFPATFFVLGFIAETLLQGGGMTD